jgi:hypothetical protein
LKAQGFRGNRIVMNQKSIFSVFRLFVFCVLLTLILCGDRSPIFRVEAAGAASTVRVGAGEDLQSALEQARPGDTILLEAGATFRGNFTLPNKQGTTGQQEQWITIRSAAPDLDLPPGMRVTPSQSGRMPKLVSPNSEAALRTAAAAHHFRLIGIEFTIDPEVKLNYGIVKLGEGNETDVNLLPHNIQIERCYIHGQALADVSRGVALNSVSSSVTDSYISECHGIGFDTQAIAGWNGPGPYKILNNYLEGAGENVLFGGADPKIPNLVPSDIEFRYNHCAKPLAWKDGILAKPLHLTPLGAASETGALVGGTTYYYRVAARSRAGQSITATSAASDELSVSLQPGENQVQLVWQGSELATAYRVYRTTDAPTAAQREWVYYEVETPDCQSPVAVCPFTDAGAEGSISGSTPPESATRWSVKNIFELKNARRVLIEGNFFENNWVDGQSGIAILFTVRNQDGTAPWSVVADVTFTNNLLRHSAGGINVLGQDYNHPSQMTRNIQIRNNLFEDIDGKAWGGGNGVFLTITEAANVIIDHNTILQSGNIITAYGNASPGLIFMNNILRHNEYGIIGDGTATGNATLDRYFIIRKFKKNAFIGGRLSLYPGANLYFSEIGEVGFTDLATGAYELTELSPLKGLATDGKDIGCDMKSLRAALDMQRVHPAQ